MRFRADPAAMMGLVRHRACFFSQKFPQRSKPV